MAKERMRMLMNPFSLVYPVLLNQTTSELQCEAATFVAQEGSTDSDQSSSVKSTPESCTQLSPQQLSQSGLSLPSSDPAKWKDLTGTDKEVIVLNGPPQIPSSFPRDSSGRPFPENIFYETLPNGEKVCSILVLIRLFRCK